jgi:hypothetical protein
MAIDCHGLVGLKEGSILIYSAVCACRGTGTEALSLGSISGASSFPNQNNQTHGNNNENQR